MIFVNNKLIEANKLINDIDKFAINFTKILEKHTPYVIVSGYVAILLGRNRGTDDIDIIIPKIGKEKLKEIYDDLISREYWCLNSSELDELYDMLAKKHSIRFAIEPEVSPNAELKFSKDRYDDVALKSPLIIKLENNELKTSFLELQIAFKEEVLKSNKDIEDAEFIRMVARGHLNEALISEYKKELRKR